MKQKGAGSQCVRRTNIGSLSFRERYLSLRKARMKPADFQRVFFFFPIDVTVMTITLLVAGTLQLRID